MPWIPQLLKKQEPEPVKEIEEPEPEPEPTGPRLAVLVPDVAGVSSFRLNLFTSAEQASEAIAELRPEVRTGVHAFWALHDTPADHAFETEVLVLIRADHDSDVVYVVSFTDLSSAHSFTRFEMKRGLPADNVLIFWAAFAKVQEELDSVTIIPAEAPLTKETDHLAAQPEASTAVAAPPEPVAERAPAPEAAPEPIESPPSHAPSLRLEDLVLEVRQPEPVAEVEAPHETPAAEPITIELSIEDALMQAGVEAGMLNGHEPHDETEPVLEPESEVQAERATDRDLIKEALATVTEQPVETIAPEPQPEPDPAGIEALTGQVIAFSGDEEVSDRLLKEVIADVETVIGDEEIETENAWVAAAKAGFTTEPPEEVVPEDYDVVAEMEKILSQRRFDQKDSPFAGFKSPPGRF